MKKVRGRRRNGLLSGMNANRTLLIKKIAVVAGAIAASLSMVACQVPDASAKDRRLVETYTAPAATKTGNYGTESFQTYKVFTPAGWSASDSRNLVVFVHGGAWSFGTEDEVESVVMDLLAQGSVIVSIQYELEVAAFEQTADIVKAVRWAQTNAKSLGANAKRTFLAGHSAGAHLSLLTAVAPANLRGGNFVQPIVGVFAVAGPYGLNRADYDPTILSTKVQSIIAKVNGCFVKCSQSELDRISPLSYIDRNDPAVYLVAGDADVLAPASHALAVEAAYEAVGQGDRAWVDVVEGAQHQPGYGANGTYVSAFLSQAGTF